MSIFAFFQRSCISLAMLVALGVVAWAQSPQVFVAAQTGADGGACGVLNPCRTISHALTQVSDGGKIVLTDSGDYDQSPLTIAKSVTVMAAPGVLPIISIGQTNSANIQVTLASGAITLNGLILDGRGLSQNGVRGTANLTVENCVFENFTGAGIFLNDTASLQMVNSHVRHSGNGILLQPVGSLKTIQAAFSECQFTDISGRGLDFRTNGGNSLQVLVQNCAVNGNGATFIDGITVVVTTGGSAQVMLDGVEVTKFDKGLAINGNGGVMRVSRSMIVRNNVGLSVSNSGQILSRGNNTVEANTTTNGVFTGTFTTK